MLKRIQQFQAQLRAEKLDGFALLPGPLLDYLTGSHFHLMERAILCWIPSNENDPLLLVAPGFEISMLNPTELNWKMFPWDDTSGPASAFSEMAAAMVETLGTKAIRAGLDPLNLRFQEWNWLEISLKPNEVNWVDGTSWLVGIRAVKDEAELELLRKAAAMATTSLSVVLPQIRLGMTEKELAGLLKIELLRVGSETLPFEPLIQSGPNSAIPHGSPGNRQIQQGDLLLMDFGARHRGYVSDITRTFHIGPASDKAQKIHAAVLDANQKATQQTRSGLKCGDIDRIARTAIEDAGFGKYFTHRTGHGMGLECHEPPYMVKGSAQSLAVGHVFTIEPGIYIPEFGGVRIEDDIVVTEDGFEVLTQFNRELIELNI